MVEVVTRENMKKEEPGSPVPIRDLQERIIEAPQTFSVLDKRQVGKLKKGDTTPSVKNVERWITQNTTAVSVTDFIEGQEGQNLFIKGDGQTTLVHGTKIRTNIAADKLLNNGRMYHLVRFVDAWYEVEGTTSGGTGAVDSVFGRTGAVVAAAGDYDAFYYTEAELNGGQLDTRYYTEPEIDALLAAIDFPVDSVFGRVGAVVAAAGDYDAFYYTEAEVDAMFAALLAGLDTHDLNDWPADAAGVLTNDGAGNYSWGAAGGGSVTGSGTAGKLSKWNTASDLTDSIVTESAALLTIVGGIQFSPDNTYDIGASAGGRPQSVWARSLFDLDDGTVRGVMSIQPSLFDIGTVSAHNFGFITNNALRAYFGATSGHFLWNNDNVNDIGAATSGRPRKIYAATAFDVGDAEYSETNIEFGSQSVAGPTYIDFHADGAATDYNTRLIRWNGTDGDFEIVQTGAGAGGRIRFFTQATARVHVSSSGNIQFDTDGANQIGLASSLRPSRICLTTDVMIGGNKIIGTRGASIPAPAATIASCQTAINTIISRMVAHGLIS